MHSAHVILCAIFSLFYASSTQFKLSKLIKSLHLCASEYTTLLVNPCDVIYLQLHDRVILIGSEPSFASQSTTKIS